MYLAKGLRLGHALLVHQDTLGTLHLFPRFQGLCQVVHLFFEGPELGKPCHGQFDRRGEIGLAKRLDQIADHAGLLGPVDQLFLAVRREQDNRGDLFLGQDLSSLDAIHARHLDVHDHHVRIELSRHVDRALPVAHFADDQVAKFG